MTSAKLTIGTIILCALLTPYAYADTYIYDWDDLQNMRNNLAENYFLANDLTPSTAGYNNYSSGAGFEPVGTDYGDTSFKGSFDGQNHTIRGLYINRPTQNSVGLFGLSEWQSGTIENVGLIDVDITGGYRVGGLVGRCHTKLNNCYVTGKVTAMDGNSVAGGLSAQTHDLIRNCFVDVDVTANMEAGGLVAFNNNFISNCFSIGFVSAPNAGGLVYNPTGHTDGVIANCFWDTQTSGQLTSGGAGTGKTTAEMQNVATFTDLASTGLTSPWDFVGNPNDDTANADIWSIDSGEYPHLTSLGPVPSIPEPTTMAFLTFGLLYTLFRRFNGQNTLRRSNSHE